MGTVWPIGPDCGAKWLLRPDMSTGLRERMMGFDRHAKAIGLHMRIDLRRRYVGMAQHLLYGAKIGAARQKVAGKGMAQNMRRHLFGAQPGFARQGLELERKMLPSQITAIAMRGKQPGRIVILLLTESAKIG